MNEAIRKSGRQHCRDKQGNGTRTCGGTKRGRSRQAAVEDAGAPRMLVSELVFSFTVLLLPDAALMRAH